MNLVQLKLDNLELWQIGDFVQCEHLKVRFACVLLGTILEQLVVFCLNGPQILIHAFDNGHDARLSGFHEVGVGVSEQLRKVVWPSVHLVADGLNH